MQLKAPNNYPFWLRGTIILIGLTLFFTLLAYGRFILMPLAISALLALLLEPLCRTLEKMKIGRVGAILLSMVIVSLVIGAIIWFFSTQLLQFAEQLPQAGGKIQKIGNSLLTFFQAHFNISPDQQVDFVQRHLQKVLNQSGQYITTLLNTTKSIFTVVGLLPFFVFFMLYYEEMYRKFLHLIWKTESDSTTSVEALISNIQSITRNYILGLLTVIVILTILNAFGLWIIGMDHVLFFAVFSSIMAIIPYIGVIIGSIPAVLYAILFSASPWMPVGVIAVIGFNQFLEGNVITPNIVGARVSINPFIALIALVVGGEVWGIVGMILFVPYVGILKCILDEIEPLKPYGYLFGNRIEYGSQNRDDTDEPAGEDNAEDEKDITKESQAAVEDQPAIEK